jgi:hypothetical protein
MVRLVWPAAVECVQMCTGGLVPVVLSLPWNVSKCVQGGLVPVATQSPQELKALYTLGQIPR